jgi:hypothetical protein
MNEQTRTIQEKALAINSDGRKFGIFAEIGAGQEVARWFFHVGKASATVAESISAYDMGVSDSLYGKADHYVSRSRLESMLDREYQQLTARVTPNKADAVGLFVFADTVATHGSSRKQAGHGWLGVRFQEHPKSDVSEVIIHVEMLERHAAGQQEAIGLIGVNLIYGAFYYPRNPNGLIRGLMDSLDRSRIEVDMIRFSGPAFGGVDNRLMSLQLVEQQLTDAAMFTADGEVVQPSEVLHNRPVLIERGSFRPVTNVTLDMLNRALKQLQRESPNLGEPLVLMEMTLKNLMNGRTIDHQDFLERVDILAALDKSVIISSYGAFYQLAAYLRRYTDSHIGLVVGAPTLGEIFDEKYYADLDGGILEGLGRLFKGEVALFVYPSLSSAGSELTTADNLAVNIRLKHLYAYLRENGFIEPIREFDTAQLHVSPADVLAKIRVGDKNWESMVPEKVAALIIQKRLFGHGESI